jgi:hypothetical protein
MIQKTNVISGTLLCAVSVKAVVGMHAPEDVIDKTLWTRSTRNGITAALFAKWRMGLGPCPPHEDMNPPSVASR